MIHVIRMGVTRAPLWLWVFEAAEPLSLSLAMFLSAIGNTMHSKCAYVLETHSNTYF